MGRDEDSLIGKAKDKMHANKAKQELHSAIPIGRQVFCHLQEGRVPPCVMVTWKDERELLPR